MSAQIPGFAWLPARDTHYGKGRSQKIRGYAQHFTAGTDSRAWLTHSSPSPVSSTFLIRHNPTLEDRGWQLVRIEDTAWTTGNANPYTVSCEYEHDGKGPIPDIAYTVMAQTAIDSEAYVKKNNLGEIPLNRSGIMGHNEWVGGGTICPDGISMDRLVAEIHRLLKPTPKPPDVIVDPVTEQKIIGGFRWRVGALESLYLPTLGRPLTGEFIATVDGEERTVQIFERAVLGWYPEDQPHGSPPDDPFHVRCLTITEAQDVSLQALEAGLI